MRRLLLSTSCLRCNKQVEAEVALVLHSCHCFAYSTNRMLAKDVSLAAVVMLAKSMLAKVTPPAVGITFCRCLHCYSGMH